MAKGRYEESSIRVLKGLEPVAAAGHVHAHRRPAAHHPGSDRQRRRRSAGRLRQAHRRHACMPTDRSASRTTAAASRVGLHPEEKVPTVEIVFTRLHAGGKFDKGTAGAYAFSGGLHGVGVSVTNALSPRLEVEVRRDGKVHRIVFAGGDVEQKLKVIGRRGGEGRRHDGARLARSEVLRCAAGAAAGARAAAAQPRRCCCPA